MRLSNVVIKPIVTEKSIGMVSQGKYVFEVSLHSNFGEIKKDIKNLYNVDVIDMRTIILPGKKRRLGKTWRFTKSQSRKKVIVTLKKGQKIDILPKEGK